MRVTVKLFALLRDRVGVEALEVELDQGATAEALMARLEADYPPLAQYADYLLLAREGEFMEQEEALHEGDVVALYPPLSGG